MGCNNTKLMNSIEGEGLPAKIRPLLRQRIEEFRKRRNVRGGEEGDLSKKELLKGDDNDHHDCGNFQTHSSDHENEVVEKTETQPPKEQTVVRVVAPVEKLSKVVPFPWPASESETVKKPEIPIIPMPQQDKDVEKKPEKPTIFPMPQQESKQEERNPKYDDNHDDEDDDDDDYEDDEDEDDEDEESEFGRYIGPGSPSFRIYCIEAEKRKEKEIGEANARYIDKSICHEEKEKEKEEEKKTIPLHNKSPSDESATSATASGNEVVEMKPAAPLKRRKRHKMKNLKKNLLHVKQIPMNRMMACTGSNDRRSLLADK